ncbi:type I methionyl aminopeptidase [Candidatus Peribacteria bacterium]|jgi:methionyl aminopeptidase|nr:type I methionyl aminopeptidase [Candidatus Peribacteria bacterium]MBT4021213.1 type I methionyl aminopeptidase [Candidatus Peribacteria bacterium]MBT4240711.1 type I methionyl aminopeptidase [Candidatus Peribacteria bacterium]MBT4473964.1 type I methionyl aminopeptidase [Candidatus Peribacteria bacterium]
MGKYDHTFQIFTEEQIESLREGGKILHDCLQMLTELAKPGVTTAELDYAAEAFIKDHEALPGFKGYNDFPATLCTSVNDVCVHGIPSEEELREGDIVGVDCGVLYKDLYTDSCTTLAMGNISGNATKLMEATREALHVGIDSIRPGIRIGSVSDTIHKKLLERGFDAVRPLTGHGLGDTLHQFPDIPNFNAGRAGPVIPEGTILAIEPISTAGSYDIREDPDGWSLRTKDNALSAHFEHTVLVTSTGCEILT